MTDHVRRPKPRRLVTLKKVVVSSVEDVSLDIGVDDTQVGSELVPQPLRRGSYLGHSGLQDVSLRVDTATFHALLTDRPTPLLRVLARLTLPESGVLQWRLSLRQRLRGDVLPVAFVPASVSLSSGLLVEDELMLPLANAGAHIDADVYERVVRALDVESLLSLPSDSLLPGQVVRVAVARSLMLGAGLLLLEEPTDGLADDEAREFMAALGRLVDDGYSVVLQTRSPDVAGLADRAFLLVDGELVGTFESPSPSALRAEYMAATQVSSAFPVSVGQGHSSAGLGGAELDEDGDARPMWQPTRVTHDPVFTPVPSASLPSGGVAGAAIPVAEDEPSFSGLSLDSLTASSDAVSPAESVAPVDRGVDTAADRVSTVDADSASHVVFDAHADSELDLKDAELDMEDLYPSTSALPFIPRPKQPEIDADSEDVIARAQNILKDLPGSVLPPDSPEA